MDNLGLLLLGLAAFGLAHENLFGHAHHLVGAVAIEEDDIVNVRAVADKLVLLQAGADEAFLAVDVEFLVGLHHLVGHNGVEVLYLGEARMVLAILFLDGAEPVAGNLYHVAQFLVNLRHLFLDTRDELVGLVLVELEDACHLYLHEAEDVIAGDLADKVFLEGFQTRVNVCHGGIHVLCLLKLLVLIDALFNEDAFQAGKMEALHQLAPADETFLAQEGQCVVHVASEHLAHRKEAGLVVVNDAAVGADAHLAVGAGIEGVDGLV